MISLSDIEGHWIRHWIKAPGFEDHLTRVHWMQAGQDFADVRIPVSRPDTGGASCLAELGAPALLALAQAEGFAGHVTLEEDRCTWHRELNWHGKPEAPDVGAISFDAQGRMIEAGVLQDYTELWSQHAAVKTKAIRFHNDAYEGLLVMTGEIGVLAIGRPGNPSSKPILAALEKGAVPGDTGTVFDGLHAVCRISENDVVATLATNPFVEGNTVLTLAEKNIVWHRVGFDGTCTPVAFLSELFLS